MESLRQTKSQMTVKMKEANWRKVKWQCKSGLSEKKNKRLQEFRKEELEVKRLRLEKEENFMTVTMSQQQEQQKQMQEFQAMMNMQLRTAKWFNAGTCHKAHW